MTACQKQVSHEASSLNVRHATGFIPAAIDSIRRHGQGPVFQQFARRSVLLTAVFMAAFCGRVARAVIPQFAPIPGLFFGTTYALDNPLSQVITVTSTGAPISFTAAASTNSGGSWLFVNSSTSKSVFGAVTPYGITVIVKPEVTTPAGTYTGQIVITAAPSNGVATMEVAVTLVIHNTTDTYFDQIAGGLTFSFAPQDIAPSGQALQIRSARGAGLSWTASTTTADGGNWLSLSSTKGTAPSNMTVSVARARLPGAGVTAGTFTGQILFTSSVYTTSDTVSVPITVNVGSEVFAQVNPLNFNMTVGGANPLSQVITAASTRSAFLMTASVQNSTGGSWLTIAPSTYGLGVDTPYNIAVGINPSIPLAVGTYMAEVIVSQTNNAQVLSIPVTLTVNQATSMYFDNVAGSLGFSMATQGGTPPAQNLQIRNAGSGTLAWTATAITADGGDWLSVSSVSGSAPSDISVAVDPSNVPGEGLTAGTFVGQVVLLSESSRVTIPVSFVVGASVFAQVDPLDFTMAVAGANPLPQVIAIASTGTNFLFNAFVVNSTGGNWLSINPSNYGSGVDTPYPIEVSVNPSMTLDAGTYSAEIVVEAATGAQALTIPVTLTIQPAGAVFFDALPGQMSFSMVTGGNAPPPQVLPIRNAGTGSLDWTAATTTADGGNWLSISDDSGTTPSEPTVGVNPANLPGGGFAAGTFTGQVVLEENGQQISVPVSMAVGANVFRQINPLTFTMTAGGANPLPQVITVASTGTNFLFLATTASSTGGNWLTISNNGLGVNTPGTVTVGVNAPANLAAGTYSSEVFIFSADHTQGLTVPVTLVVASRSMALFDSLPGQLTFSMVTRGTAPPSQPLEIRNAGTGSLDWMATASTSDGGAWLTVSAASGIAPSVPQVSVVPAKIPGGGFVAGTFTGQVVLGTSGDRVTIPVTFAVGANVFRQVNGLNFNKVLDGPNPLPQLINIASTGAAFPVTANTASSTGGNWLQISPSSYGFGIDTTIPMIVTANPVAKLAAGTYTSEILLKGASGSLSLVIPVTLTINPAKATFFGDMPGAVTFFKVTGGANPAAQSIPIRNAGAGTLNWTATATTSDGGKWLSLTSTSGVAPDSLSVSIESVNLPGKGSMAGSFNGQIVLTAGNNRETLPVAVVVGANIFEPVAPLTFSKNYGGPNPGFEPLTVASSGTNFNFAGLEASATGGSWLFINGSHSGFEGRTPRTFDVSVDPAANLEPGSYLGEVILTSANGGQGMVVPVALTISSNRAATPHISLGTRIPEYGR